MHLDYSTFDLARHVWYTGLLPMWRRSLESLDVYGILLQSSAVVSVVVVKSTTDQDMEELGCSAC